MSLIQANTEYYIGLMSGTSMDGSDAVCVAFVENQWHKVVAHHYLPFNQDLRNQLLSLQEPTTNELHLSRLLAQKLSHHYAQAIEMLQNLPSMKGIKISAIGCHGQTIRHQPEHGYSIQLADFAWLAEKTRLPVIGDFRAADIAAGGQGAPLVPAFHQALFAKENAHRIILNLGGIANLTLLDGLHSVTGFDTGPGNMLMDAWMQTHHKQDFDYNGDFARSGSLIETLLTHLLADDYFQRPPPKSTGRDLFSLAWLNAHLNHHYRSADVMRTLLECTARSIVQSIQQFAQDYPEIYLCGGGAHNTFLQERLHALLPHISLQTTDCIGLAVNQVEAAAFAWLAYRRMHQIPSNIPSVTGATAPRLLGTLWQAFPLLNP